MARRAIILLAGDIELECREELPNMCVLGLAHACEIMQSPVAYKIKKPEKVYASYGHVNEIAHEYGAIIAQMEERGGEAVLINGRKVFERTLAEIKRVFPKPGLIIADFSAKNMRYFDEHVMKLLDRLYDEDVVFITSAKGPTAPLLMCSKILPLKDLGERKSTADIAQTIATIMHLDKLPEGESLI